MSKPLFGISVAFAALIVTTAPAMAQRHPGPTKLRDADHSPPTTAILVPALIRSRAQPDQPPPPGNDSATDGHVKVFDGATLRASEPQPDNAAGAHVKVFDGRSLRAGEPQPDAAAGHVKAFDGATLRAGEPQPDAAAKPILSVRKAGERPEPAPQPAGGESGAHRMPAQNNIKHIGLAAH